MADLVLSIRLTADGKGLVGEVRVSREELEKLKKTTEDGTGASKRASEAGDRHGTTLQDLGRNARAAGLTIAALTAAIAFQTKRWIDDAASMQRWQEVTGKSVESLAVLKFVAEQTSVSFDLLMATYQRLPRSIVEGLGENSEAARAFKALAIDPRQLKANDEGMLLIVDRLRQVEDRGTRAAIAQMIFKQRGEDLLLWVNQGAEGIRRLTQEGERWATVTGTDAQRANELKNEITKLNYVTDALAKSVFEQVIPSLSRMIERMREGALAGGGLRGALAGFLTGTDLDKWNADFSRAVERLGAAQTNVERLQASSGWMRQGLPRATAEFEAARADLERLQAIKPIMFPEAPTTGAAQGAAASGGIRQPTLADLEPPDTSGLGLIRSLKDELASLQPTATTVDRVMRQLTDGTQQYTEANRATALAIAAEIDLRKGQLQALEAYIQLTQIEAESTVEIEGLQRKAGERFEQIQIENMTELEQLEAHLSEKQLAVNTALAWGLISEAQAQSQSLLNLAKYEKARTAVEKAEQQQRLSGTAQALGNMSSLMQSHNRSLFEAGKIFAIGQALVRGYLAVQEAYEDGMRTGGFWVAAAYAAAAGVFTTMQVLSIKNAQFGGGGATPVFSATPAGVPTAGAIGQGFAPPPAQGVAAPPPTNVHITFVGGEDRHYTYKEIAEELIPLLNEAMSNGATITVSTT